jgi:hypothetical protein
MASCDSSAGITPIGRSTSTAGLQRTAGGASGAYAACSQIGGARLGVLSGNAVPKSASFLGDGLAPGYRRYTR